MPRIIAVGKRGPIRRPVEISYDPTRGQIITARWESLGQDLAGVANTYANNRIAFNWTNSPHKSVLVAQASAAQLGYPERIVDTWQILANEIQKDLKEFPPVLAMEAAYPGTLGYITRDVDLYNQGKPPGTPAIPAGANPTAGKLFNLLIRGTTHFPVSQYVLKHSTNVSNAYAQNVADVNVGKVYTTAALLKEVQDKNSWVFPLPGRMAFKITNIPAPAAVTDYQWGFRKLASTETTTADNRIEISTEYWLEQWSTFLYAVVPDP